MPMNSAGNATTDNVSSIMPFPMPDPSAFAGTGLELDIEKTKSKSAKQLAELQGKIQKQLAEQQFQYQQQLQAMTAQQQLAHLQAQQNFQKPFTEAELTGYYNGSTTLNREQLQNQNNQFNANLNQEQRQFDARMGLENAQHDLNNFIQRNQLDIQRMKAEHDNAIATGQLELAREIQRRQVELQQQDQDAKNALARMQTSGYMDNGQLTEAARAARAQEALNTANVTGFYIDPVTGQRVGQTENGRQFDLELALKNAQTMGRDANGNLTDASQQWRTSAGLDYARTAAQLSANPADYFEAAAYMRNAGTQDPQAFLREINAANAGGNAGFRTGASYTPASASMQSITGQMFNPQAYQATGNTEGPSGSIAQAEAAANGAQTAYTTTQNVPQPQFNAQNAPVDPTTGRPLDAAQQRLAAFQPVFQAGAHKLAPGALEAMSPTERALFSSGLKASGQRPEDFESAYKRSRLQTGAPVGAL